MSTATATYHILILCEGNHCRSPLAEALLRKALGPGIEVSSAGFEAMVGQPVHKDTRCQGAELGLDLSAHRGRQLRPSLALDADLILVMDRTQKEACEALAPSVRGRVFLLGHWLAPGGQEIADPIHRGPEAHRVACGCIQGAIQTWLPRLAPRNP